MYPIVAYKISPSLDHLDSLPEDPMDREFGEAENYDALIYKATDQMGLTWGGTTGTLPFPGLQPVNWVGFLDRLPHQTDFLSTNCSDYAPLISKRMLYVLRSVAEFPHQAISTRIYDFGFQKQGSNNFKGQTALPAGDFNEDYVALQLLEHVDGIDPDSCKYEDDYPGILPPSLISWEMKEPTGGFSPIFRLKNEKTTYLFISPAAKEALESSGIKGLGFTEYEGTRAQKISAAI